MLNKAPQIIENQLHLALARGQIVLPAGLDRHDLVARLADPECKAELVAQNEGFCSDLRHAFRAVQIFRREFAAFIARIALAPHEFDVSVDLRDGQRAALLEVAERMRLGMQRPVIELPTGSGKSHVLGVVVRAYLEAEKSLRDQLPGSTWHESEILVLTSRINLLSQLARREVSDESPTELKLGDLRRWTEGIVSEDRFRVLMRGSSRESHKEPIVTVMTYQGLSLSHLETSHHQRPVGLVVCDESHNVTERVRSVVNTCLPGAFIFGASATVRGPRRNPFFFFEAAGDASNSRHWSGNLAYRDTLISCIERGELKKPRYVEARVNIDLDKALGDRDGWSEEAVASYISRNVSALQEVMREVFSHDVALLRLSGSPGVKGRKHMVFVKRVALAEELARFARAELGLKADFTYGRDPNYERKKLQLETGELNMLVACKKLTEGFDVKSVNAVWLLWPHAEGSEWLLTQEIGRGLRFDPDDPEGDCLLIDGVYNSTKHDLASVLGIFESSTVFNGGLLAPGAQRALEHKLVTLLQSGGDISELTAEEREQAERLGWKLNVGSEDRTDPHYEMGDDVSGSPSTEHLLKAIQVIERQDIAELLRRRSPVVSRENLAQLLNDAGFPDRLSLLTVNPSVFMSTTIGSKKGFAFYTLATGQALLSPVKKKHLRVLADLVYPASADEEHDRYRSILSEQGMSDRLGLLMADPNVFAAHKYAGLRANAFYALVTGAFVGTGQHLTSSHMEKLADILYPAPPGDSLAPFRELLRQHGYGSRMALQTAPVTAFSGARFHGRTGRVLYTLITRNSLGTGVGFSKQHLVELANLLYPSTREGELQEIRTLLSDAGLSSRLKLLTTSPRAFERQIFGTRSGRVLYTILTGDMADTEGKNFTSKCLRQIADIVYPGDPASELAELRQMAVDSGFPTAESLYDLNPNRFYKVTFGNLKGLKFLSKVMGRTVAKCKKAHLHELAARLFGPLVNSRKDE